MAAAAAGGSRAVVHAASAAAALELVRGWAAAGSRAVVALDLVLGDDAAALHDALEGLGGPVLVVSGYESDRGRQTAARRGWRFLAKPFTEEEFRAALDAAAEEGSTPTMSIEGPDMRTTPAPRASRPDPGDDEIAPDARLPSDAPLHADPGVAKADLISRRALRGAVALLITGLTVYGDMTGHPVSGVTVAILGALGMGAKAFIDAAKKRPAATAIGGAGIVALALGGTAMSVPEAGQAAAIGAALATVLVDAARGAA